MSLPAIASGNAPSEGAPAPRENQRLPAPWGCQRLPVAKANVTRRRKLAELAEKVRQLQAAWRPTLQRCPTGLAELDAALGGGFALGCIHELLAPTGEAATRSLAFLAAARASDGSAETFGHSIQHTADTAVPPAVALRTDRLEPVSPCRRVHAVVDDYEQPQRPSRLQPDFTRQSPAPALRVQTATGWVFYIDTEGDFYPPAAAQLGLPLERLLVIRTRRTADALWVCEQALRCQALAAVVLPIRTLDAYVSRRLQLAAEVGGGLGFILRRETRGGQTFAATRLRLDPLPGSGLCLAGRRPTGTSAATQPDPLRDKNPTPCVARDGAPAQGGVSATDASAGSLDGQRRMRITLLKLRDGRPAAPFELTLPLAAACRTIPREAPQSSRPSRPPQLRPPCPSVSAS